MRKLTSIISERTSMKFAFSLRSLFWAITLFGIAFSLFYHFFERRRQIVAAIERAGGDVVWRSELFEKDLFDRFYAFLPAAYYDEISQVDIRDGAAAAVPLLGELNEIGELTLIRVSIDDEDLSVLRKLSRLRTLSLIGTNITDQGLSHISGLLNLESLDLRDSSISDAGIKKLKNNRALQRVCLSHTQIGDEALRELSKLPSLYSLNVEATNITDAGIRYVVRSPELHTLNVDYTQVTDQAMLMIQTNSKIRYLDVCHSKVTKAAVSEFNQTRTNVVVEHESGTVGPKVRGIVCGF